MYRVVADTNVLISTIMGNGKPRQFLREAAIGKKITLVTSGEILSEMVQVLCRPKFNMTESQIEEAIHAIVLSSDVKKSRSRFKIVIDDPDDDMIINAAYDGHADYIVSGDSDQLELNEFKGI